MVVELKKKRVLATKKSFEELSTEIATNIHGQVNKMVEVDKSKPRKSLPSFSNKEKGLRKGSVIKGNATLVVVPYKDLAVKWISLLREANVPVRGLHGNTEDLSGGVSKCAYICTLGYVMQSKDLDLQKFDCIVMDGIEELKSKLIGNIFVDHVLKLLESSGKLTIVR